MHFFPLLVRNARHRSLFSNPTRIGNHGDEASITVQRTEYRILCSNIQRHFHEYSVRRRTSRSEGFCNGPAPAPIMVTGIRYRELHARSRVCAARGDKMSFSRTRCPKRQHREEKPKRMASPTQRHPEFKPAAKPATSPFAVEPSQSAGLDKRTHPCICRKARASPKRQKAGSTETRGAEVIMSCPDLGMGWGPWPGTEYRPGLRRTLPPGLDDHADDFHQMRRT